eukprot:Skav233301  [mRNA]  locus=scaffold3742:81842:88644:- [translate_table: standard]
MLSWETLYTVSGGAAAPYVTGLAEALVQRGHEVHVFTRASHGVNINVETVNGVVYHEVPYLLSMDFVEETANFCKALAEAITQREAAFGHFDVAHGHELVARARAGLRKDLHFVLTAHSTEEARSAGAEFGTGHLRGSLERRIEELGIGKAVAVPSRQDFYGVDVIESWAAARPVIGAASGELRHLIKPDATGYMADQDQQISSWMGEQGWEQVQQSFLWDTIAKRTEEFYINMLGLQETEAPRALARRRPLAAALGADAAWLLRICRRLDKTGKHKFLAMFQMCLIRAERCLQWLGDPTPDVLFKERRLGDKF